MLCRCLETISAKSCKANFHQPLATTNSIVSDSSATPKSFEAEMLQQTVGNVSPKMISIGSISDTACTPRHSPEDIKETDSCNPEMSFETSVNSYNQKRRKIDLRMSSCNKIDSFYPVDSISSISRETDLIPESPCLDNCSVNQQQKHPRQGKLIRNVADKLTKMLKLSCLLCRSPLGLHENDLLVECSLTSSSKVHLAYVLEHGPPKDSCFNCPPAPERDVPVVICDGSSVDHRIFDNGCKVAASHGIWSEKDGCVFRSLICPFCNVPTCLGVQIIAADASNSHLLNKVMSI